MILFLKKYQSRCQISYIYESKIKTTMKDYTIRFVYDRKNETGFRDKDKKKPKDSRVAKKYKEDGLLQIEVKKDGTDKRVYVSTNIRIRPDQFDSKMGFTCKNHTNAKGITGKARDRLAEVDLFVLLINVQICHMSNIGIKQIIQHSLLLNSSNRN